MDINNFKLLSEYSFINPNKGSEFLDDSLLEDDEAISLDDFADEDDEPQPEGGEELDGSDFADEPTEEEPTEEEPTEQEPFDNEVDMGDDITSGDEVEVDVTDIVNNVDAAKQSSDAALSKIDSVIDTLNKTIEANNKSIELIQQFDAKIDSLEQEFIKRNPTPMEKLETRVLNTAPYNIGNIVNQFSDMSKHLDNYEFTGIDDKKEPEIQDDLRLTPEEIASSYNEDATKNSFKISDSEDDEDEFVFGN